MKLYLDNIKQIDWLYSNIMSSSEGVKFMSCKAPAFFVVYYNYIEDKSEILIKDTEKTFKPNELLYRKQYGSNAEYTSYLQEPYNTNNLFFYLLLKNINPNATQEYKDKLENLFLSYKAKDIGELSVKDKIIIKGSYEINGKSSYYDALTDIFLVKQKAINGIQAVSDMIDSSLMNKTGFSFYGGILKKIVLSIPDTEVGLIPEEGGVMRYMFVGEKAFKNDTLQKAKSLLREGKSLEDIYLLTGWFWNKYDKKWRFRIPSSSFKYKPNAIQSIDYNGETYNLLVPESHKNDRLGLLKNLLAISILPDEQQEIRQELFLELISKGYNGKLNDLVEYDELFALYPEIPNRYCFYFQSMGNKTYPINDVFYNEDEGIKKIVLLGRSYSSEKTLTIIAHEIQHAVQTIEGFGNGGNPSFAKMITTSGTGSFRRYYFLLTSFLQAIIKNSTLISLDKWHKLADDIENSGDTGIIKVIIKGVEEDVDAGTQTLSKNANFIRQKTQSESALSAYSQQIAYCLLANTFYYPKATQIINDFVKENIGEEYSELFSICSELINKDIQKTESFKAQGWTNLDIKLLNFRAYQYLVGEFESRYIQQTVKLTPDLVDYFIPYTSETINPKEVNVYGSDIKFYTDKSYQYGIELTADNKYILHTKKDKYVPQMFLHELGHIIFDFVKDKYLDEIEYGYDSKSGIGTEEYFCESFVDYVVRTEIDKELSDTIKQNYTVKDYDKYDAIFYDFFLSQEYQIDEGRLGDMLLFVNKIIELV